MDDDRRFRSHDEDQSFESYGYTRQEFNENQELVDVEEHAEPESEESFADDYEDLDGLD